MNATPNPNQSPFDIGNIFKSLMDGVKDGYINPVLVNIFIYVLILMLIHQIASNILSLFSWLWYIVFPFAIVAGSAWQQIRPKNSPPSANNKHISAVEHIAYETVKKGIDRSIKDGDRHYSKKNFEAARKCYLKALDNSLELEISETEIIIYEKLSELFCAQNNYKEAYQYAKKIIVQKGLIPDKDFGRAMKYADMLAENPTQN